MFQLWGQNSGKIEQDKQGASPKNKVLDFLITNSELDYSLKEIANYSGAGYSTIKILIKKLVKGKWIIPTRKISKVILYKLNTENPEVKIFIEFYWKVIENELGIKEKKKTLETLETLELIELSLRLCERC